jgi:hypothetical protein
MDGFARSMYVRICECASGVGCGEYPQRRGDIDVDQLDLN